MLQNSLTVKWQTNSSMNKAGNRRIWLTYATFLLLFAACSTSKNVVTAELEKQDEAFLVAKLDSATTDFEWFKAKINCEYWVGEENESFEIHLKVRADSVINMTIRKMGFTGAKALLEVDSVTFLNTGKVGDKYYTIQSYNYINKIIGATVDYFMIQDLFFANPYGLDMEEKHETFIDEEWYYVSTLKPKHIERAIQNRDLSEGNILRQYWLEPNNYYLAKQRLYSIVDTTSLVMNYSDYEIINEIAFPLEQEVFVTSPSDTVRVQMSYSKVEFNEPQNVSLTIPDDYERR